MTNALTFLTDDEKNQIEQAIREAEKKTAAEMVCAVATESGRYDRAEGILGIVLALLVLGLANLATVQWQREPGDFTPRPPLPFVWQALAVTIGFVAGNLLGSYVHPLRRLLVSKAEMDAEVSKAASHVFAEQKLHTTRSAGGLLIYISLFEHQAVILADDGIVKPLGQEFLQKLRDTAVERLHKGQRLTAFIDTIQQAAAPLAEALPAADETDELPNHLVCIHPRP